MNERAEPEVPHIVVLGGGITGLTAAFYLLRAGMRVTVLESRAQAGGLSCSQDFGVFHWDRFYHCILTSDQSLLQLLEDIGLSDALCWKNTEVGFYSGGELYKMTTPRELLRYPCLTLWQKIRFGLGTMYIARIRDGLALESVPIQGWLIRIFGKSVYQQIWEPLLRCKLGETRTSASAAFLWATIRRLYSTRSKGTDKQERLGYVRGGYHVVLDRLCKRIKEMGGQICTNICVEELHSAESGVEIIANGDSRKYDACILTVPNHAVLKTVTGLSADYRAHLKSVTYLGMVCVVLVLRRKLSEFYVTNITDAAPFTGIIEMTNLISTKEETNGHHLVYLPKYTPADDPLFSMTDEEVWQHFCPKLFRMHPDLREEDIEHKFVFRERTVQPIPRLHYSQSVPGVSVGLPYIYLANTSQIINNTLNNNVMTSIARSACAVLLHDLLEKGTSGNFRERMRTPDALSEAVVNRRSDVTSRLEEPVSVGKG
ncbi:MAG: NAD(P)/FAD-dependent oxidoreductase [Acidobacteriaceae bacterium]